MNDSFTPAMLTVLREAPDDWAPSHAHAATLKALERRGCIEIDRQSRVWHVRRTDLGRQLVDLRVGFVKKHA